MPLYEFNHVVPLSRQQKDVLAEFITDLHSNTFSAPRFFVYVRFEKLRPAGEVYIAAKYRGEQAPNHVLATVRTGPTRTKEMFDEIALKLNDKWNEVVSDAALGATSLKLLSPQQQRQAKTLKIIGFRPLLASVENGVVIPAVGDEAAWVKENVAYFQKQVDEHDDEEFKEMLQEIHDRKLLQ